MKTLIIILVGCTCVLVYCKPVEEPSNGRDVSVLYPRQKRFVNPSFALGEFAETAIQKLRTKRSEEDCEKLQLCKLHARSRTNFISAFELYFVNRENARLWDHRARTEADCDQRFPACW